MKKTLLFAALATIASMSYAEQKTVTFDFTNPAAYGYAVPEAGKGTQMMMGGTISADGVTITNTNTEDSETAVRFYNSNGAITFRLAGGGNITITAGDCNITSLSFTGANNVAGTNFKSTPADTWSYNDGSKTAIWTGSTKSINIVRLDKTIQMSSMTVVYETEEGGGNGGNGEVGETERFVAITWDGSTYSVDPAFSAVVEDPEKGGVANNINEDGVSIVTFGTKNVDAKAVGGTTAKECDATGVTVWNEIKWDYKNQGDILFAYIVGTGNPVFGYDIEEISTDGVGTGNYRQSFTGYYYTPDCGKIPAQGLYYEFTAKVDGALKLSVWSNKGNRNTYLIDKATATPVKYEAEGYINGQDEVVGTNEDGSDKKAKKWLSTEEIQALHDNAKCQKDSTGAIIPDSDSAPYVIGAGNQNYWGNVCYVMKAGQTVLLFQDSSQIGFRGFEFTPGATENTKGDINGIESINAVRQQNSGIYDISGRRVSKMVSGRLYIQNGQKIVIR